jgi:hypothetical protein
MASSATEERTNGQGGNAAAEDEGNGQSESGAKKALKIGALAAAAGTAAYAASKAMTPSESQDEGESKDGGGGGRTSMEQIVSAIGNSRWDVLRDLVVPFAESGARSAGTYVATEAPDFVGETLVPKFIEGFVEAKGKKITSSD